MAGNAMMDVQRLVVAAAMDDWISDYEVQGDFQAELSLDPPAAFRCMADSVVEWIRRDLLVPGELTDGLVPWQGSPEERATRFAKEAQSLTVLTSPGQICWFDSGPAAPAALED